MVDVVVGIVEWNNYFGNRCVIHHQFSLSVCVFVWRISNVLLLFGRSPFSPISLVRFWCFSLRLLSCVARRCETFFMLPNDSKIPKFSYVFSTRMPYVHLIQISLGVFPCLFCANVCFADRKPNGRYMYWMRVQRALSGANTLFDGYNDGDLAATTPQSNGKLFTSTLIDFYLLTVFLSRSSRIDNTHLLGYSVSFTVFLPYTFSSWDMASIQKHSTIFRISFPGYQTAHLYIYRTMKNEVAK